MSYLNPNSRTITAFFDNRTDAARAAEDLAAMGVPMAQVRVTDGYDASAAPASDSSNKSFWEQLKDFFLPHEDRYAYAEGLQRGGFLLTAQVDNTLYDRALGVLDTDGAINMNEREASWRASGWQGYQPETRTPPMASDATFGAAADPTEPALVPTSTQPDGGISAYDESRVGIRDISHGRDRLRSYTMRPVPDEAAMYGSLEEPSTDPMGSGERFSPSTDASLIAEHMDVIALEGTKIGTVDHLQGDQIKLTKSASPDGQHHFIPLTSVDHVDAHVHLKKSAAEARAVW